MSLFTSVYEYDEKEKKRKSGKGIIDPIFRDSLQNFLLSYKIDTKNLNSVKRKLTGIENSDGFYYIDKEIKDDIEISDVDVKDEKGDMKIERECYVKKVGKIYKRIYLRNLDFYVDRINDNQSSNSYVYFFSQSKFFDRNKKQKEVTVGKDQMKSYEGFVIAGILNNKSEIYEEKVIISPELKNPYGIIHNDYQMFVDRHEDKTNIKKNVKTFSTITIGNIQYKSLTHFIYSRIFESSVDEGYIRNISNVDDARKSAYEMFFGKKVKDRMEVSLSYKTLFTDYMREALISKYSGYSSISQKFKQALLATGDSILIYSPSSSDKENLYVNEYLGLVLDKKLSEAQKQKLIDTYVATGKKTRKVKVIKRVKYRDQNGGDAYRNEESVVEKSVEVNKLGSFLMDIRKKLRSEDSSIAEDEKNKRLKGISDAYNILYRVFQVLVDTGFASKEKIDLELCKIKIEDETEYKNALFNAFYLLNYESKNKMEEITILKQYNSLLMLLDDSKFSSIDYYICEKFGIRKQNYFLDFFQIKNEERSLRLWEGLNEKEMFKVFYNCCVDYAKEIDLKRNVFDSSPEKVSISSILEDIDPNLQELILAKCALLFYKVSDSKDDLSIPLSIPSYKKKKIKKKVAFETKKSPPPVGKWIFENPNPIQIVKRIHFKPKNHIIFDENDSRFGIDHEEEKSVFGYYPSVTHYVVASMTVPRQLLKLKKNKNNLTIISKLGEKTIFKDIYTDKEKYIKKTKDTYKTCREVKEEFEENRKKLFNAYIRYFTCYGAYIKFFPIQKTLEYIGSSYVYRRMDSITKTLRLLPSGFRYVKSSTNFYESDEYTEYMQKILEALKRMVDEEYQVNVLERDIQELDKRIQNIKPEENYFETIFNLLQLDEDV